MEESKKTEKKQDTPIWQLGEVVTKTDIAIVNTKEKNKAYTVEEALAECLNKLDKLMVLLQ